MKYAKQFNKNEIILIFLLACIQFTHIVDFMILMPLGPQITRLLDISNQQFGYLVSIYTFAAGVSGFLSSFFVDFFDRKKVLLLFFVGFTLGTIACGLVSTYYSFMFVRLLTGAFGGVLSSIVLSIVSDNFEYQRRGLAIGTVMGAFALASVFGVPFGLYLATQFEWQTPFLVLGSISAILLLFAFLFIPLQNRHLLEQQEKRDPLQTFKMIGSSLNQQMALILMFFLVMGQFSIIPFISMGYVYNAKLPESSLPLIYLFGGICSLFAGPTVGRLSDMFTKTKVFSVSLLISIIPIYLITNLGPSSQITILIISCSFFIVMSGRLVPAMALITSTAPPNKRAGFLSIVSATQQLSAAFAAIVAGYIMSMSSNQALALSEHQTAETLTHHSTAGTPLDTYYLVGYLAIVASIITFALAQKVKPEFVD